jgi:hypothetical protein
MDRLCKVFVSLLALVWLSSPASAQVVVAFYSHEFGSSFPHTFIKLEGVPERGGAPVDANYGFTAVSVSPAILMGSVAGKVESAKPGYIANSDRQFALKVSDAQYDALVAIIDKWRRLPGKSYNLNKRNCIHFVGEIAATLGLKVELKKELLKKPRSFLQSLMALNPWVRGK